jgi:hypothetical protein
MKQRLWRLAQYASTITMWTVLGAGAFALSIYVSQYSKENWSDRDIARQRVEADTADRMRWRAIIGGFLGALGSCIYVARCVIKRQDP